MWDFDQLYFYIKKCFEISSRALDSLIKILGGAKFYRLFFVFLTWTLQNLIIDQKKSYLILYLNTLRWKVKQICEVFIQDKLTFNYSSFLIFDTYITYHVKHLEPWSAHILNGTPLCTSNWLMKNTERNLSVDSCTPEKWKILNQKTLRDVFVKLL